MIVREAISIDKTYLYLDYLLARSRYNKIIELRKQMAFARLGL